MNPSLAPVAQSFELNSDLLNKAVAGIPPEQWLVRPGNKSNHLLWVAGHLVNSRASAIKLLGGSWSVSWRELFKRGAPLLEANQYPQVADVIATWQQTSAELATAFAQAAEDALSREPLQGVPTFDGKLSGNVAFLSFHETYHIGQAAFIRKWLGYDQIVG